MLQLGKKFVSNEIETWSARFLKTLMIKFISRSASYIVISTSLEQCLPSDTFTNAVIMRNDFVSLFTELVPSFIKEDVKSTLDKCHMTQLYAELETERKKWVSQSPSLLSSYAMNQCRYSCERESSKRRGKKKEKRSSRRLRSSKSWKWSKCSSARLQLPRRKDQKSRKSDASRRSVSSG